MMIINMHLKVMKDYMDMAVTYSDVNQSFLEICVYMCKVGGLVFINRTGATGEEISWLLVPCMGQTFLKM